MSVHTRSGLNMRDTLPALLAVFSTMALAGEEQIELKEGAGRDTVMANCIQCHSVDYIPMHAFMRRADWQATVDKMVNVMGASISQDNIPVIVDYLAKSYGVK